MIQTHNLIYRYPQGPTLTFPDIAVAQGGVLLLSGPSGCGKSTWLALVAALMAPTSGAISVAEQDLTTLKNIASDAWRAGAIGLLPQKLHLSSALNVYRNLAMAQWAAGQAEDPARIDAALRSLGVDALAQRMPAQLSGGQAQRVALARAVLLKPRVVLADEPTASLDDAAAEQAVRLLQSTTSGLGATLVIATHDARVSTLLAAGSPSPAPFTSLHLAGNPL